MAVSGSGAVEVESSSSEAAPTLPALLRRQGSVTGRVTGATTGRPLRGAQVQIPGPDLGALTDSEGRYRIDNVPAGKVTFR